ncbi:MAG: hypothetical protein ACKVXR_13945 [Planctomycetota bacterium]
MKVSISRKPGPESGVALLVAIIATFLAASFVAVTMAAASVAHRNAQTERHDVEAQYLAEGGIEAAKREIQVRMANWSPVPNTGSLTIGGKQVDFTIQPTGFTALDTDPTGIQTIVTGFEVHAFATTNGIRGNARRIMNARATPLFQYAVFYDSDLEIQPGPNMTIRGRVHSNGNLHLASGATLTLDTNYVRAAGDVFRRRKDDPSNSSGTVSIRNWVSDPFDASEPFQLTQMNSRSQMSALGITTTSGYDSAFTAGHNPNGDGDFTDPGEWLPFAPGAIDLWGEPSGYAETGMTLMTHEHGVTASVPPGTESTAMFEPVPGGTGGNFSWNASLQRYEPVPAGTGTHQRGHYHENADLSILTYADGTWRAYDTDGYDITGAIAPAVSIRNMYDARQANGSSSTIRVTQIDMGALATTGRFPANGLLYAANYGAGTGLNARGIRLTNGSTLADALTVATPDPLYIRGNYNTVNQQPAAVICDAFNLLSNAWNDTKTRGNLPAASDTTYNVAVVTGNVDTAGSQYSGGFENLPRYHENWTGKTSTIRGSFVKPWFSQYATQPWVYGGDRYQAPIRAWSYDTSFNSVANLPPFTPMAVTVDDIVSW